MDLNRVIKARIVFDNQNDILKMVESQEAFRQGCNFVSDYIFNHDFPLNATALNKVVYNDLRERFGLKSQMAQSCIRTVVARYKTVQTQLCKQRVWDGYKKDNHGKNVKSYINKGIIFLWKPIVFSFL